jgi:hypothetical protein
MAAMRTIAAIAVSLTVLGCGVAPVSPELPAATPFMSYRLGDQMRVATGYPMVSWTGNVATLPAFQLVQPLQVDRVSRQPPAEGTYWLAAYQYHGPCAGGRYVVVHPEFYEQQIGIVIDENGVIPCAEAALQVSGGHRGRVFQVIDAAGVEAFVPSQPVVVGGAGPERPLSWELIYGGRSGDWITIDYRESIPSAFGAPPVETYRQQLRYDLKASRRIVFRETEIDVIDASNAGITYRVVRDAYGEAPGTSAPRKRGPG